ncbi:MAG: ABC transporter ATP-binding protein [Anaerolineae bacterium]
MDTIVKTKELSKHFGPIRAVDGLNLAVQAGEIYGLLGPNGSGKTTLIRLITGLLKPTSGSVTVLGQAMPSKAVLAQVGYMTQVSALYEDLTLQENVAFFAEMCGGASRVRIDEVVALADLQDRAGSLVRTLSGGMKQRTSLACALVHRPRLLLLDEPTVGVDPQLRATFWSYFRRLAGEGVTLVVSSHVMDEAERCDRLGFMRQGRLLAEGTAAELRAQAGTATLEEAFLQFAQSSMEGEER